MKNNSFLKIAAGLIAVLLVIASCRMGFSGGDEGSIDRQTTGSPDRFSDILENGDGLIGEGLILGNDLTDGTGTDDEGNGDEGDLTGDGSDSAGNDGESTGGEAETGPDGTVITGDPKQYPGNIALYPWEMSADTYVEQNLLILVNKHNPADQNYAPPDRIRPKYTASNRSADGQYMTREAADAFNALAAAAANEGYEIVVTTAYRSYGFQSTLYNNYVAKDGQAAADTYSARPGYSEHQTGLAADVSSPSVGYALTRDYKNAPEGIWLADNCWQFGFIIRFPEGKDDITGYTYEPWHIRYVGIDNAKAIYDAGVTLEEYLGQEAAPDYI